MNCEEALLLLEEILPPGSLNNVKSLVFREAWEGKSYPEIAEAAGYTTEYIKMAAAQMWKALSANVGEKVTKQNFRAILRQRYGQTLIIAERDFSERTHAIDWEKMPDIATFYGYDAELAQMQQYILADNCRLVAVLGMGGMGKTSLVAKLVQQIQEKFDYIIWRSFGQDTFDFPTLLKELIAFLSDRELTEVSLKQLIECLRVSRCLIVLDEAENLLQSGSSSEYRDGYEEYDELFKTIGEMAHQSCLILTSREKLPEIAVLEGAELPVRSLQLTGSLETSLAMLKALGISGTIDRQEQLCQDYSYNPLILKIVATSIQDIFDGNLTAFQEQDSISFNGVNRLLKPHIQRLGNLEKTILLWLAINRDWTNLEELRSDIIPAVAQGDLLEALESLSWRSLVKNQAASYTVEPLITEYLTNYLIERVCDEIEHEESYLTSESPSPIPLFQSHALCKTTVTQEVRAKQVRLILQPISERLKTTFASTQAIAKRFCLILDRLRKSPSNISGYGAGNLINLCVQLQIDLSNYDLSHLVIWHAYLKEVKLQKVNLSYSNLTHSVFNRSIRGILAISFSSDGKLLTTGNTQGEIIIWEVKSGRVFAKHQVHNSDVLSLAFSPNDETLVSSSKDGTLKFWNIQTDNYWSVSSENENEINAVAWHPDGRTLISGGSSGYIKVWNAIAGELNTTLEHGSEILTLAWSPDGKIIASGGKDRELKLWNPSTGECLHILQGHNQQVNAIAFSPDSQTLASGSEDRTIKLWDIPTGKYFQTWRGNLDSINSVAFSPNGPFLASGSNDCLVKLWNVYTGECLKIFNGHTSVLYRVVFSPDGEILASSSKDGTVKLWELKTEQCYHTLKPPGIYEEMNITGAKGLTDEQLNGLKVLGAIEEK